MVFWAPGRGWLVTSLWAATRPPCARQRSASINSSCGSSIGNRRISSRYRPRPDSAVMIGNVAAWAMTAPSSCYAYEASLVQLHRKPLMPPGGSARRNRRTLHDDAERCKTDEQNRQQQEHVGKAHHGRLTPGHQGHLLECHGRGVAAEVVKARGERCKHLGRRTARPVRRVVQSRQVQVHAVIDDGVEG